MDYTWQIVKCPNRSSSCVSPRIPSIHGMECSGCRQGQSGETFSRWEEIMSLMKHLISIPHQAGDMAGSGLLLCLCSKVDGAHMPRPDHEREGGVVLGYESFKSNEILHRHSPGIPPFIIV